MILPAEKKPAVPLGTPAPRPAFLTSPSAAAAAEATSAAAAAAEATSAGAAAEATSAGAAAAETTSAAASASGAAAAAAAAWDCSLKNAGAAPEKSAVASRPPPVVPCEREEAKLELEAESGGFAVYRMRVLYMRSKQLHFVFIKMRGGALWIWVGDKSQMLRELEAAFPLKSKGEEGAVASTLFSDSVESSSKAVASKLAERFDVPVFLSVNVGSLASDGPFQLFLQQLLQQQISLLLSKAQHPTLSSCSKDVSTDSCCCPPLGGFAAALQGEHQ